MSDLHSGSVTTLRGRGDTERRAYLIPKKSVTFWGPRNPEPSQKSCSMFTVQRSIRGKGFWILNVCSFTANQAQGKNTLPACALHLSACGHAQADADRPFGLVVKIVFCINRLWKNSWRKWVGIEPTSPLLEGSPDLKSGGSTSHHPLPT